MKVTLLFCLIAVYGAVADDDEVTVSTDAAADASADSSSLADAALNVAATFTPGNIMDNFASAVNKTLDIKNQVVNETLEIVKDGVNMGATAAEQGLSGAKDILQKGLETAKNITDTVSVGAGGMVSKGLGIANTVTLGKISTIIGAANSTAQAGIKVGDKAANMGMNLGNNVGSHGLDFGKSIVGKFGRGFSSGMDFVGKADKAINAKISGGVNAAAGAASSIGQNAGSIFTASWKMPSKSSA